MHDFLTINGYQVRVKNLEKIFWPEDGYTKADLIRYYIEMSNIILPHIENRPMVMSRYPDGIDGDFFYQKNLSQAQTPPYLKTHSIYSPERGEEINYIIGNGVETLVFMANLGAIELHPWLSTINFPDNPDWAIFDLDPAEGAGFDDVITIAKLIHNLLDELRIKHFFKTSGATGLHIYVPLKPIYTYEEARNFVELIGWVVVQVLPEKATIYDRRVKDRKGKVYIDYLQNIKGKTITGVYSLRPLKGAPVSTPILPDELTSDLCPVKFNIKTISKRIEKVNDLFKPVLLEKQEIDSQLNSLKDEFYANKK